MVYKSDALTDHLNKYYSDINSINGKLLASIQKVGFGIFTLGSRDNEL